MNKVVTIQGEVIKLANLEKEFFPGITKAEVIDYYSQIAEYILPHLQDRPLSLRRFPNGVFGKGFYQKNIGILKRTWMKTALINDEKPTEYLVCENKLTLIFTINLASFELHPWLSRTKRLYYPDFIVIDLDPPGDDFKKVVEVGRAAKAVFDRLDLGAYAKTSGMLGLHLYIPTAGAYDYNQSKYIAFFLAHLINREVPELTTLERAKEKRQEKIYLDFLQNIKGQTIVSPYSLRANTLATVSMPIFWDELNYDLSPHDFTIKNSIQRIKKMGDIFSPVLKDRTDFKQLINKYANI